VYSDGAIETRPTLRESPMRIFMGNLAFTTTEEELALLFHSYDAIASVHILTDRDTGRSRGFGFVKMPNATEAQTVIAGLNGTSLGGRTLTVNEVRPREEEDRSRRPRW
jgi:RNA recognition motif-containing protein